MIHRISVAGSMDGVDGNALFVRGGSTTRGFGELFCCNEDGVGSVWGTGNVIRGFCSLSFTGGVDGGGMFEVTGGRGGGGNGTLERCEDGGVTGCDGLLACGACIGTGGKSSKDRFSRALYLLLSCTGGSGLTPETGGYFCMTSSSSSDAAASPP